MWFSAALAGEQRPDMIVCVSDATNLKLNLRLVLEVKRLGLPMMLALNMTDLASKRGITIDVAALQRELGMPVVNTVAVRRGGASELLSPARSERSRGCLSEPMSSPRTGELAGRPMSPTSPPRSAKCAAFSPPASASRRSTRAFDERIDRRRPAPGVGAADSGGHAVPDVSGGIQLGQPADGDDHRQRRRLWRSSSARICPKACCAACWSMASSPASAACWSSCRRS
jgi:hypothetical protein